MPAIEVLTGVAQVSVSEDDPATVPSMAGVTMSTSLITPQKLLLRSGHTELKTTDTCRVTVAAIGRDRQRKGYTISVANALSASLTPASNGEAILIKIDTSDFPANLDKAVAMAVFLQVNAADPQLVGFAQIDGASDFVFAVHSKPSRRAPKFPIGTLTAATATPLLGSRDNGGVTYLPLIPTTGGVRLIHKTSRITIRPDDAPDFDIVTSRATDLQFSVLSGDNEFLINALGGNYVRFTDSGLIYEQAETDLQSAIAQLEGNRSILVDMPEDTTGLATRRLYLGNVTTNFSDVTENTSKTDQFQIDFNLQAAALDYFTKNLHGTSWLSVQ